jgi:hypothetical protein
MRPSAPTNASSSTQLWPPGSSGGNSWHVLDQQPYDGPPRPTSGLAITALVLAIFGISIVAVIYGHIALGDIRRTGKEGRSLAVAGLVLGYSQIVFWISLIGFVVVQWLGVPPP